VAAASALLDRGWGKLPALSPDNVRLSDLEERFVCAWVDDEAKLRAHPERRIPRASSLISAPQRPERTHSPRD
jgi:hypothetical protein